MKLSLKQKEILHGTILGDGYLQPTGKRNARLRIEHSAVRKSQKEYIEWKYQELKNIFQQPPIMITRVHPLTKKINVTLRLQSHSSPYFGDLRSKFYRDGKKILPKNFDSILHSRRTFAVWYMDDGYYDQRDHSAHLYLPRFQQDENEHCIQTLKKIYGLDPKVYCRPDRKSCQLNFTGEQSKKLFLIIDPYLIPIMKYKSPNHPHTSLLTP